MTQKSGENAQHLGQDIAEILNKKNLSKNSAKLKCFYLSNRLKCTGTLRSAQLCRKCLTKNVRKNVHALMDSTKNIPYSLWSFCKTQCVLC